MGAEKLERERARTLNKAQPKTNYKEKYEHLIGKDAALDAAHSLKTDTDSKLYGMGVSAEQKKDKRTVEDIQAEVRSKLQDVESTEAAIQHYHPSIQRFSQL